MKKLCFIVYNFNHSGGMEKVNSILVNELATHQEYDITLLSLFGDIGNEFFKLSDKSNINIKYLFNKSINVRMHAKYIIDTIEKEILSNHYQVVISGDLRTYLAKIKKKNQDKFKLILWEHFNCTQPFSLLSDLGRRYYLKYVDSLVVLTKRDQSNYVRKFGCKSKIIQIYNPLLITNNVYSDIQQKRILTIGRIEYQKGYDKLINIAKVIAGECKDWSWDIYGDGLEIEKLKERIAKEGLNNFIHLKGKSKAIDEIYSNYSIFALTSRYEGMPLVLLEAYAHHLPMISFDCDCGPSEIIRDCENGFLIPCYDECGYAIKLLELIKDEKLRIDFSNNSNLSVREFDLDYILNQWMELINA